MSQLTLSFVDELVEWLTNRFDNQMNDPKQYWLSNSMDPFESYLARAQRDGRFLAKHHEKYVELAKKYSREHFTEAFVMSMIDEELGDLNNWDYSLINPRDYCPKHGKSCKRRDHDFIYNIGGYWVIDDDDIKAFLAFHSSFRRPDPKPWPFTERVIHDTNRALLDIYGDVIFPQLVGDSLYALIHGGRFTIERDNFPTNIDFIADIDWDKVEKELQFNLYGNDNLGTPATSLENRTIWENDAGYHVVNLLAIELPEEGRAMRLCVGDPRMGYIRGVAEGNLAIWSMRNPGGKRLFTIEVILRNGLPHFIPQIKGKANRPPGWAHADSPIEGEKLRVRELEALLEFLDWLGIPPSEIDDLDEALEAYTQQPRENPPRPRKTFSDPPGLPEWDEECLAGEHDGEDWEIWEDFVDEDGTPLELGTCRRCKTTYARRAEDNPASPSYLRLSTINKYVPDMERRGVSEVARSGRGFLTAYKKAGGDPDRLSDSWDNKRAAFIARHMAQVKQNGESLWENGEPTRRHLALIAWAYSPNATRL